VGTSEGIEVGTGEGNEDGISDGTSVGAGVGIVEGTGDGTGSIGFDVSQYVRFKLITYNAPASEYPSLSLHAPTAKSITPSPSISPSAANEWPSTSQASSA